MRRPIGGPDAARRWLPYPQDAAAGVGGAVRCDGGSVHRRHRRVSQQKEFKLANYYCRVRRRYRRHCCETRLPNAEGATGYELTSLGYELTSENPEQHNMC